MAAHKMLPMKDPAGEPFSFELADIYLKMGLREEALAQYKILFQHYKSLGRKDKALKVMALMAQMNPREADLKKEITGLEHLMKLKGGEVGTSTQRKSVIPEESFGEKRQEAHFDLGAELEMVEPEGIIGYKEIEISEKANGLKEILKKLKEASGPGLADPSWNYNMGVACRELGLFDDAIEHFRVSYEKRQNPFDSAYLLGLCFKEKVMWEEALQAFKKALSVKGISQGNILAVRYEMGLIFKEQGKTEEALELLRKILGSRSGISGQKR